MEVDKHDVSLGERFEDSLIILEDVYEGIVSLGMKDGIEQVEVINQKSERTLA